MNTEIERAYIVHDVAALRPGLARAGFSLVKKESQVNLYLDHPFLHLIEGKKYVRVRWIDGWANAEISFSHPSIFRTFEVRPQYSIHKKGRKSTDGVVDVLKKLGFFEALIIEKERELFTVGGGLPADGVVHVELDTGITIHPREVEYIPRAKKYDVRLEDTVQVCIEVSGGSARGDIDIDNVARDIGLRPSELITENYFDRYFNKPELH